MYCINCGKEIDNSEKTCPFCGAQTIENGQKPKKTVKRKKTSEQKITNNITLGSDGKYRWRYDMSLFKNPTVFLLVYKIFFFIFAAIFAVVMLTQIGGRGFFWDGFLQNLKYLLYVFLGMTAVVSLGYLIYALSMGGKYCVEFEMNEAGVEHKQTDSQAEKARKIASTTVMTGMSVGSPGMAGRGMISARTEMYSEFSRAKKVKAYKKRNLIKIKCGLSNNQVYAEDEDFDFVYNYIIEHCPNLKTK